MAVRPARQHYEAEEDTAILTRRDGVLRRRGLLVPQGPRSSRSKQACPASGVVRNLFIKGDSSLATTAESAGWVVSRPDDLSGPGRCFMTFVNSPGSSFSQTISSTPRVTVSVEIAVAVPHTVCRLCASFRNRCRAPASATERRDAQRPPEAAGHGSLMIWSFMFDGTSF
jgi:hypothetical protein